MSSGWQEAAAQRAEEVSSQLRRLFIRGLGLLHSELGLELGLEPQRYPSWVFLVVPVSLGLLLLFLLLHCTTSRGSPSAKRAAHHEKEQPTTQLRAPVPSKAVKVEEPKKKSKKKAGEKAKPNGRPVELAEEVVIPTVRKESSKQQLDAEKKNEKLKKNKKKPKADTKQTQSSSNQDKKEAEEGNWETKISNKEKRQQRKRDKGADTDVGASDTAFEAYTEAYITRSTHSTNIRKSKGQSEASAVNGSSWNEKPTKVIPSQLVEEKWVPPTNTAGKKKAEPCTWNQDTVDSNGKEWSAPWGERSIFPGIATWSTVDSRLNSSEKRPAFSTIGINKAASAAVNDSIPQTSATDNQWEATPAEPSIDDEWSGLNGNSGDPSSDWNPPAEEWGNYGEDETAPNPQTEEPEQEVPKVSDDDKDKEEQAAGKTKKKKKKKKKQEESGSATQEAESTKDTGDDYKQNSVPAPVIPTVVIKSKEQKEKKALQETRLHTVFTEAPVSAKHNNPEKNPPQAKQPQETNASVTKQNSVAPPSQAKSEESWESPKQVKKKKKARRET